MLVRQTQQNHWEILQQLQTLQALAEPSEDAPKEEEKAEKK